MKKRYGNRQNMMAAMPITPGSSKFSGTCRLTEPPVVLANGSMSSAQSGEDVMRRAMVEADVVDCMIALPVQLFYSTPIPACLWFLARNKKPGGQWRDRRGEVLFIDSRKLGSLVDRTQRELSDDDIAKIAGTYHAWRGEPQAGKYEDIPGSANQLRWRASASTATYSRLAATLAPLTLKKTTFRSKSIRKHGHVLTPGHYVGAADVEEDDVPFEERFAELNAQLEEQFAEADKLTATIRGKLSGVVGNG